MRTAGTLIDDTGGGTADNGIEDTAFSDDGPVPVVAPVRSVITTSPSPSSSPPLSLSLLTKSSIRPLVEPPVVFGLVPVAENTLALR